MLFSINLSVTESAISEAAIEYFLAFMCFTFLNQLVTVAGRGSCLAIGKAIGKVKLFCALLAGQDRIKRLSCGSSCSSRLRERLVFCLDHGLFHASHKKLAYSVYVINWNSSHK